MTRTIDAAAALVKARAYCARQERCQQEVRDKLYAWQVAARDIEGIISQLIGEGFLNEARFAEHYAVSKFRQKCWGWRKIEQSLRVRQVSEPCIALARKAIGPDEHQEGLARAISRAWGRITEQDPFIKQQKVLRTFLRKGFDADAIRRELERLR